MFGTFREGKSYQGQDRREFSEKANEAAMMAARAFEFEMRKEPEWTDLEDTPVWDTEVERRMKAQGLGEDILAAFRRIRGASLRNQLQ